MVLIDDLLIRTVDHAPAMINIAGTVKSVRLKYLPSNLLPGCVAIMQNTDPKNMSMKGIAYVAFSSLIK